LETTFNFRVRTFEDELDGGWIAVSLDFPEAMSQGEDEQEALRNVMDAIMAVLETKMEDELKDPNFRLSATRLLEISRS
jgi:predicted RNase H-like HicB family nuclease